MTYLYGLLTIPALVILWAVGYNIYLVTPYGKRKQREADERFARKVMWWR